MRGPSLPTKIAAVPRESISVSADCYAKLQRLSLAQGVPIAWIVESISNKYIDQQETTS